MSLTPAQCRAGRALLHWSQKDLDRAARVAQKTIADFELDKREPQERTLEALQAALEKGGVVFIEGGEASEDGGPGVRLKRKPARRKVAAKARSAE